MGANSKIGLCYAQRSANRLGIPLEEYSSRRQAGQKWCSRCRAWHQICEFAVDRRKNDGLRHFCRVSTHRLEKKANTGTRMKGKRHSEATRERMRLAKIGSANHNWKGGITPISRRNRQNAEYQRWRRKVIARDDGVCQKCGETPEHPHAHHLMSIKTHPHLATDPNNGITVCPPCHRHIHAESAQNGQEFSY